MFKNLFSQGVKQVVKINHNSDSSVINLSKQMQIHRDIMGELTGDKQSMQTNFDGNKSQSYRMDMRKSFLETSKPKVISQSILKSTKYQNPYNSISSISCINSSILKTDETVYDLLNTSIIDKTCLICNLNQEEDKNKNDLFCSLFGEPIEAEEIITDEKKVLNKQKESFVNNIMNNFGFDIQTCEYMYKLYDGIKIKYKDEPNKIDWFFSRAISQIGGSYGKFTISNKFGYKIDEDNVFLKMMEIDSDGWTNGAGKVCGYGSEQNFFNDVGISNNEFIYLRYKLRLQHFMTSTPSIYSYDSMLKSTSSNQLSYKKSMEKGLNKNNICLKCFKDIYEKIYSSFKDKGDFAHMMYTLSANLIDKGHGVTNYWDPPLAGHMGWKDSDERKDIVGWLGDAIHAGGFFISKKSFDRMTSINSGIENVIRNINFVSYYVYLKIQRYNTNIDLVEIKDGYIYFPTGVSFGNDDYISDLDADNISHMSKNNLIDSINNYYSDISDNKRKSEFLKNNPYKKIEKIILLKLSKNNIEELKTKEFQTTYNFLNKLNS